MNTPHERLTRTKFSLPLGEVHALVGCAARRDRMARRRKRGFGRRSWYLVPTPLREKLKKEIIDAWVKEWRKERIAPANGELYYRRHRFLAVPIVRGWTAQNSGRGQQCAVCLQSRIALERCARWRSSRSHQFPGDKIVTKFRFESIR